MLAFLLWFLDAVCTSQPAAYGRAQALKRQMRQLVSKL